MIAGFVTGVAVTTIALVVFLFRGDIMKSFK